MHNDVPETQLVTKAGVEKLKDLFMRPIAVPYKICMSQYLRNNTILEGLKLGTG
jgi:hypothetical protein